MNKYHHHQISFCICYYEIEVFIALTFVTNFAVL